MSDSGSGFWTQWPTTQSSTSGSQSFEIYFGCAQHSVRRIHARGSNHLVRREYGECVHCGKAFRRIIRWDTHDARSWWEPIEDAA